MAYYEPPHQDLHSLQFQLFSPLVVVVVAALLFYVHCKHLRSCRDGQFDSVVPYFSQLQRENHSVYKTSKTKSSCLYQTPGQCSDEMILVSLGFGSSSQGSGCQIERL